MALHHTVVQQMARTSIGERSTFKLDCIHFMDKAVETQNKADTRDREVKRGVSVFLVEDT